MNTGLVRHSPLAFLLIIACIVANGAPGAERKVLSGHLPPGLARMQSIGTLPATTSLRLAIGLPLRNQAELTNFLRQIYDPASTSFHRYLTCEQFTERFGPTEEQYQSVIEFARANGFTITAAHPNRLLLDVSGPVANIEQAFRLTLRIFHHPTEPRDFHAPDAEPSVPLGLPIQDVSGLEDFAPPRPMNLKPKPHPAPGIGGEEVVSYATGSGPGGDFIGYDFRGAYAPGVLLTGVGQFVGLFEFGPYFTNDIILYKQYAGLPDVTVTNVLLDGFTGIPAPGTDDGEEALDIDMAMCMAPGATIIVYEGNSAIDILNRIATDNKAKQIGCSFGFYPPPGTMDSVFAQFLAQGQTFFAASGDGGAYSTNLIFAPADDPNITSVGGTSLVTTGPRGSYVSENTWIGSGGGITPHYSIPTYQQGMNMQTNHGSTTQRNFPDVAMLADTVIFWVFKNGQTGTVGGTSAAAPLWAGFMALVNQQAVANGKGPIGNLDSVIYNIGRYSNSYPAVFHDITTGNNFNTASPTNYAAIPGYDLATGWGSPNGSNLINLLAAPTDALNVMPGTGFTISTPFGIPFNPTNVTFSLTNAGAVSLDWTLVNTSAWLTVSAAGGTLPALSPATNIMVSLNTAAATNLNAGTYYATVLVTNTTSGVVQSRLFTFLVSPANFPLTLSGFNASLVVPTNGTPAVPRATAFDIPNNFSFYQAGLNTNASVTAGSGTLGFPASGGFVSAADGLTAFQLAPYGANSALMLGSSYAASGTLSLASPQSFNSLAVLASSANGGGVGSLVIHFSNGSSSAALSFNAQDWFGTTANVALQGFGRLKLGTNPFSTENNGASNPNLYQTIINLAALGLNQPVASVTFTKPAASGTTAVLGLSGALMPPQVIITQQPLSVTNNNPPAGATLSVVAMGTPTLSYQWYSGSPATGTPVAGQTSANLNFTPVSPSQAGNYFVVISNAYNTVTSTVATLTVQTTPAIVQQPSPTNLFLLAGQAARFNAVASGAVPLAYSWRLNGSPISGATASAYAINNVQPANSGNYSLLVSNSYGMVTSSVVALTVFASPSYPYGQAVLADHPIAYWRLDETNGSIAHDYVGGLNGAYTNVALGQAGNNLLDTHKAARFGSLASANSYVANLPIDFGTAGNATFSVEAWVNGAAQSNDNGLVTKGTGAGGEQFNLDCGSGSHAFRFFVRDAGGGVHLANGTIAPNGAWHHVVGVCDEANGRVILYVDGVSNASSTITAGSGLQSSGNAMTIGSRQSGAATAYDLQFVGNMEEIAIYTNALTAARVQAHFVSVSNRPPVFLANPFTELRVNAGQGYSGTIATNASDPNGDAITFAKVSGPAWLGVAGGGALSGTPGALDAGTNSFIVSARDPAGLSNTATMFILVNGPPSFTNSPFAAPGATAGQPYSASISGAATDPNNDPLSFAKLSGPAWLTVAVDGTLAGTPLSADVGANSFVVSATDPGGLSASATMTVAVAAGPPLSVAAALQGANLVLSWSGGIAPYQVQITTNLAAPNWQLLAGPISTNSLSLSPTNDAAFYRVRGQ
jgi:hypothetical protein